MAICGERARFSSSKGAFQFSAKPVEPESREVHVLGLRRVAQSVQKPPNPGGLPGVYLAWVLVIVTLYPFCRWVAAVKARRRDWWLSYL